MNAALTPQEVASQLGTNSVSVLRLIARRALPAAKVSGDDYRISPSNLEAYVSAGAPDFKNIDDDHPWFRGHACNPLAVLRKQLPGIADDPTDEQLRGANEGTAQAPALTVNTGLSPAIRDAITQTPKNINPWSAVFRRSGSAPEKELSLLQLLIVDELYTAAKSALRSLSTRPRDGKQDMRPLLSQFYASTVSYDEAIAKASEKVSVFSLRWYKLLPIVTGPNDKPLPNVNVTFVMPLVDAAGGKSQLRRMTDEMIAHAF